MVSIHKSTLRLVSLTGVLLLLLLLFLFFLTSWDLRIEWTLFWLHGWMDTKIHIFVRRFSVRLVGFLGGWLPLPYGLVSKADKYQVVM